MWRRPWSIIFLVMLIFAVWCGAAVWVVYRECCESVEEPYRGLTPLPFPINSDTATAFYATDEALRVIQTATAVRSAQLTRTHVAPTVTQATIARPSGCPAVSLYVPRQYMPEADPEDVLVRTVLELLSITDADTYRGYNALWQAYVKAPEINLIPPSHAVIGLVGDLGTDDHCELWRMYTQLVETALRVESIDSVWVYINYEPFETLLVQP
jgi:hypothetical protein